MKRHHSFIDVDTQAGHGSTFSRLSAGRSLVEGKQLHRLPTSVEISDNFTLFARAVIRPRLAQGRIKAGMNDKLYPPE